MKQQLIIDEMKSDCLVFAEDNSLVESVYLYGSLARGQWIKKVSDVNLLILVKNPDYDYLAGLGKKAGKAFKKWHVTPLIMSVDEFMGSADVFPLEYSALKKEALLLSGREVLPELELGSENMRHQLEDRLRGLLMQLRQTALIWHARPSGMQTVLLSVNGSLQALWPAFHTLSGSDSIPVSHPGVFNALSGLRDGEKSDVKELMKELLSALTELVAYVDGMEVR